MESVMSQEIITHSDSLPVATSNAAASPVSIMLEAIKQGATLEQVEKMMDLQDRWQRGEARKAYDAAFAAFKGEAVSVIRGKDVTDGPLKGKSYSELHDWVDAVTPALSKHGLSSSWKLTRDEKDWMEVTCYLRHVGGHEESTSMGGPPDAGGAKNAIQARASTKTYLERYTLKAITGLSEKDDDKDGRQPVDQQPAAPQKLSADRFASAIAAVKKGTRTREQIEAYALTIEQKAALQNAVSETAQ